MFNKPDKSPEIAKAPPRDEALREQFPRSQPHPARSFDQPPAMRIGKTVVLKGELIANEDITILGRVEGTITVREHTLTIGKGANIQAEINAHNLIVEGEVTGNVVTTGQLEVAPAGILNGDVKTPSLVIRDGAALRGSVDMDATQVKQRPVKAAEKPPAPEQAPSHFKLEREGAGTPG